MAITLPQAFGTKNNGSAKEERPASKFWMNVGYEVEVPNKDGEMEKRFVSLPAGIPLDNIEPLVIKGKNQEWNMFQAARNDLLAQLMAAAEQLEPGQEELVMLQIQLRRVDDSTVEVPTSENPFARNLFAK